MNIVVWPNILEKYRPAVLGGRLALVRGRVQRAGDIVHLVAAHLEDLTRWLDLLTPDHTSARPSADGAGAAPHGSKRLAASPLAPPAQPARDPELAGLPVGAAPPQSLLPASPAHPRHAADFAVDGRTRDRGNPPGKPQDRRCPGGRNANGACNRISRALGPLVANQREREPDRSSTTVFPARQERRRGASFGRAISGRRRP